MSKQIEKEFNNKLTKKDYLLYLINRNVFILVSPLIILALIIVFIFMVNKDGFQFLDIIYMLPIALFILSYVQMYTAVNKAEKSNKETKSLKVILSENKYKEITESRTNSLDYSKFYSFYENKDYFYLYVDKINALILPKREFNEEETTLLKCYFESNIQKISKLNARVIIGIVFSVSLIASIIILIISML